VEDIGRSQLPDFIKEWFTAQVYSNKDRKAIKATLRASETELDGVSIT
jgi:hypothetical protein